MSKNNMISGNFLKNKIPNAYKKIVLLNYLSSLTKQRDGLALFLNPKLSLPACNNYIEPSKVPLNVVEPISTTVEPIPNKPAEPVITLTSVHTDSTDNKTTDNKSTGFILKLNLLHILLIIIAVLLFVNLYMPSVNNKNV